MATKKSKTSSKSSSKAKTTKPKAAAKPAVKSEIEAPKTKTAEAKTSSSAKETTNKSCLCGFFAKKYDENESFLTVFKTPKFYGALLGEVIGTMLIALLFFAASLMGLHTIATYAIALIAILIGIYAFSGACLNPLVSVGMMASRRLSVVRGIMYIIAEIVGAWLGWLIFNAFHVSGGETAYDIPTMSAIAENGFWIVALLELLGAAIIAFFFARALKYKRSVFTFAAVVSGGIALAMVIGYVVSAAFLGLNNNFIFNPALAMMFQIFPSTGDNFGEIIGGIFQALSAYAIIPMIGGVIGFYLSDFTAKLSGSSEE